MRMRTPVWSCHLAAARTARNILRSESPECKNVADTVSEKKLYLHACVHEFLLFILMQMNQIKEF